MALKVTLLSVRPGASHTSAFDRSVDDYLKRCGKAFSAAAKTFRTEDLLLEAVSEERKRGAAAFWIADLGGKSLNTEGFAEKIRLVRDGGIRHLLLAIGPADGWSATARTAAELRISLSAMTLPHELAWLVLAEQIYRASTILLGHPYHLGH